MKGMPVLAHLARFSSLLRFARRTGAMLALLAFQVCFALLAETYISIAGEWRVGPVGATRQSLLATR